MNWGQSQRAIATLHSFRFFGLVFILPGVIGPNLPAGFAEFAAYGDFVTGILASPTQINILTPPNAISGSVNVVVTDGIATSLSFAAQAQAISPSFFVFDGTHVAATHLNGSFIGPTTLYPGLSTPAAPGETVVIYANGFGPTSVPVVSGSSTQSGILSPLPQVTIGGATATVKFAGLVAPGEFQFNVVVPTGIPNGDNPIVATYNGASTQTTAVITVEQ